MNKNKNSKRIYVDLLSEFQDRQLSVKLINNCLFSINKLLWKYLGSINSNQVGGAIYIHYNETIYRSTYNDFEVIDDQNSIHDNLVIDFNDVVKYYKSENITNLVLTGYRIIIELLDEGVKPDKVENDVHSFLESTQSKTNDNDAIKNYILHELNEGTKLEKIQDDVHKLVKRMKPNK